jgi:coenzyme F420-dependent glucose-6-phosphate dehydrogenase
VPKYSQSFQRQSQPTRLRLGYKASSEQFRPNELLDYALLAENVGLDSVWISDHFQPWRHTGGHAPFSLAWLGALGARSSRVIIGTSVLTPTFRYHPAVVAHAFGTLGAMFPGRVALGIGTGESLNEVPSSGIAWPEQRSAPRFRSGRQSTAVERGHSATRTLGRKAIYGQPDQPVPITSPPQAVSLPSSRGKGDNYICTSGKNGSCTPRRCCPISSQLQKHQARQFDRRMIEIKLSFDTDPDRALNDTRFWGALALTPDEKLNVEDPLEMEKLADALPIERAASRWIVSDDPQEAVERIGRYIEFGFNHLVFHAPGPDQARFLRLFGEQLAPRLRAIRLSLTGATDTLRIREIAPPSAQMTGIDKQVTTWALVR